VSRRLGLLGLGVAFVLAAAGCGTGGISHSKDAAGGKSLFVQHCGSCHTLAAAGTNGQVGPNLDDAFKPVRDQGFEQSTIQQVVLDQIREASCTNTIRPSSPSSCMPQNLVTGSAAESVAAFVAFAAGNPQAKGGTTKVTTLNGKQIFLTVGCTGCHTLKDAGSHGTIGPNLDQAKPPKSLVVDRVTNGKGAMPSFKTRLSPKQIDAVATYVSSVAGK
jgi:cbb3-type cytochrome c oxidase subunit III